VYITKARLRLELELGYNLILGNKTTQTTRWRHSVGFSKGKLPEACKSCLQPWSTLLSCHITDVKGGEVSN
jgi:hypothetical protein